MSDQEQRDGGFFVVRGGLAVDVTIGELMNAALCRWTFEQARIEATAREARERAGTAP